MTRRVSGVKEPWGNKFFILSLVLYSTQALILLRDSSVAPIKSTFVIFPK